jgi:hypothetical protein
MTQLRTGWLHREIREAMRVLAKVRESEATPEAGLRAWYLVGDEEWCRPRALTSTTLVRAAAILVERERNYAEAVRLLEYGRRRFGPDLLMPLARFTENES